MVDLNELGRLGRNAQTASDIAKLTATRLGEEAGLSSLDKLAGRKLGGSFETAASTMREALALSTVSRLGEEARLSSLDKLAGRNVGGGFETAASTMREALGLRTVGSAFGAGKAHRASDLISKQLSTIDKAVAEAVGSRIGDYRQATDNMHSVFGRSASDAAGREINGLSAASEADKYIAQIEKTAFPIPELPVMPPLPLNPIHKTNQHLQNLAETTEALLDVQARQSEKVEALLDVQARQADKVEALLEVQAKQADMIDALLTAFVASAVEQGRSAKRNLTVAVISAVLALIAVIATAL